MCELCIVMPEDQGVRQIKKNFRPSIAMLSSYYNKIPLQSKDSMRPSFIHIHIHIHIALLGLSHCRIMHSQLAAIMNKIFQH